MALLDPEFASSGTIRSQVVGDQSDDPARRQRVQAAIETLVRFMVERAANAPTMGVDDAQADNP